MKCGPAVAFLFQQSSDILYAQPEIYQQPSQHAKLHHPLTSAFSRQLTLDEALHSLALGPNIDDLETRWLQQAAPLRFRSFP